MKQRALPATATGNWASMGPARVATLPLHVSRPGAKAHVRNPANSLGCALLLLQRRELSRAELAEQLERRFPGRAIHIEPLVRQLTHDGQVQSDGDGLLGLTEHGEASAEKLPASLLHPPATPAIAHEAERRTAVLAPGIEHGEHRAHAAALLTRSPARTLASHADLAEPPIRPEGQLNLAWPSRVGQRLHYRDGRVTEMDGTQVRADPSH